MAETIVISRRFRGPADSGNGGCICGLIAELLDAAGGVEVTLRVPPPLETEGRRRLAGSALYRGSELLAVARAVWFVVGPEARDRSESR